MADSFVYSQPVKIWFGPGKLDALPEVFESLNVKSAVVVADRFIAEKAKELQRSIPAIRAIYTGVEPNPQLSGAAEVAELCRQCSADAVLGIGGGSVMDTTKFASAIANGGESPEAYYEGKTPFPSSHLTVITVPTTAGTGSEVTQVSVMNRGTEKKTINHPVFMPKAAIVDPVLSSTVPPYMTMITGLDAMAHALEGFWSRNHQPITDHIAKEAVRLVRENLETAYRNGSDMEARSNMALAALLGGLSFALPKTAGCHACSYPLSEDCHLPHGEACAFTLDSFVRINRSGRLDDLAKYAGFADALRMAEYIRSMKKLANLKTRLSDLGGPDVQKLASDSAAHPLMRNNPVEMDEKALAAMFEALA
ncbi:MAG: iron-containing alcohol dehydrogenase [Lachnospiraceae bacterium]|nr:iron-containing alcohol dehydrogenase [Lachnospiraceae bacterium]